ncbi:CDP-alcohol phosphatidyltransferase family protein [Roseiconus lacunae]|uniref:CDP-alcohol phosphatidyltransferase family protein n=1 Tax=Roseiconus lacunae TaxID=2605694 RepID=A0ABT7PKV4_9BACT|nr:CDP-alcohol phosphatidyltransferase family protein [Roseiconus lacunae]MCD0461069.1 CDP-alcohol phosphatidyltransferase family protein [Roseiconus lacunae]MDM4016973.1 CDP-alcohol phosphatidyltransferase family protein [Roseiconus lacunae]WRQ48907.1 CDP-alcohol phosphatidyltransferase family protein [Stieleria sp. HD01]
MSELKGELRPKPDDIEFDESELQSLSKKDFRRQKRRRRRKLMLAVLPTMLTLGNGMCGLGAIAVAVSGPELAWPLEQKLFASGLLIFGGMLFDALDGSAARMTGQETEFGGQLDSLCDAVTFGTAPAVIIWRISDALPQRFLWACGVLFTLCVLIRLARFNVETDEDDTHETFEGLPSPAAAGTLAAFALAMPELKSIAEEASYNENLTWIAEKALIASHYVIPTLAGVLAYLMVSRFQYPHLVAQYARGRRSLHQIGQALFVVVVAIFIHWMVLPIAFCYYSFWTPLKALLTKRKDDDPVELGTESID